MKIRRLVLLFTMVAAAALVPARCFAGDTTYAGSNKDRVSLEKTGAAIRAAFAAGDVDAILAYHHPDVIKALSAEKYLVGRDAVKRDLLDTFQAYNLRFEENHVESTLFQGDTAVEESTFSIRGTPKNGGQPFIFKGRSLVVYVRYKKSPTGWASIREIIQPAS
jgi:ketosteroid isomerase-like protein